MSEQKINILVVDDEMHVRFVIKSFLSDFNVELLEAREGREALEILKFQEVDLVILDNNMPLMDGRDVLNWMLLDKRMDSIPVVVYTAGGFDENLETQLIQSSAAFLIKSNLGDDLIPTIKEILGDRLKKI